MIAEALTGCATVLGSIDGVTVHDHMPARIVPPCIAVTWGPVEYSADFEGDTDFTILAAVMVPRANLQDAQTKLAEYVDPTGDKSVYAKINADPTLGGAVSSARVVGCGQAETETVGNVDVLMVTFTIGVYQ